MEAQRGQGTCPKLHSLLSSRARSKTRLWPTVPLPSSLGSDRLDPVPTLPSSLKLHGLSKIQTKTPCELLGERKGGEARGVHVTCPDTEVKPGLTKPRPPDQNGRPVRDSAPGPQETTGGRGPSGWGPRESHPRPHPEEVQPSSASLGRTGSQAQDGRWVRPQLRSQQHRERQEPGLSVAQLEIHCQEGQPSSCSGQRGRAGP